LVKLQMRTLDFLLLAREYFFIAKLVVVIFCPLFNYILQKLPKHSLFVMVGGDSLNHQASLHHQTKSACNANKHRVTLIDSEIQLAHLTVSLPNIMLQACFIT